MTSFHPAHAGIMSRNVVMTTTCLVLQLAAVIRIAVTASNSPPSFKPYNNPLFILESSSVGVTITTLEGVVTSGPNLTFSISGLAASILRIQQIGPTIAAVVLSSPLNYAVQNTYTATYTISDGINPPISRNVDIFITSSYNNAPSFPTSPFETTIFDNVTVGSTIINVKAQDVDSGVWGALTYQFQTPQDKFSLNPNTGNVVLVSRLDYTTLQYYLMGIIVTDGGGLNATTTLTIHVLSSLGQIPAFFNMPYTASIYENATVGSSVVRVNAVYIGIGPPVSLSYSIISGGLGMFDINPTTGWIFVNDTIRWENAIEQQQQGVVQIVVQANQSVPNYQSARALVTVTVIDINNYAPRFNQQQYNAIVSDCSLIGSVVSVNSPITVTDLDQGDGAKFRVDLTKNGVPFNAFQVVPNLGASEANLLIQVLDPSFMAQHRGQSFTFDMVASEYLTVENRSSTARVNVTVVTIVGIAPVFAQDMYTTTLDITSGRGTFIITLTASNAVEFDVIEYSLLGPAAQLFSINSTTGSIFLNAVDGTQLDPFSRGVIYVGVVADDTRNRSAATLLAVQLHGGPSFDQTRKYVGFLAENSLNFIVPVTVQAIDRDMPPSNQFSYALMSSDYSTNFRVDASSGNITVVTPLDYESLPSTYQGQLQLTVVAIDSSNPSLNSTSSITIIVEDVNDCAPAFKQSLYTAAVYVNSTAGTYVTGVSATDCDSTSPNNIVSYFIEDGSRDNLDIDNRTGVITVSSSARLDTNLYGTYYDVTVLAIDSGSPPQVGRCVVRVTVVDVGIKPPRITTSGDVILASVAESTAVNTAFYNVIAINPAGNSRLQYSLLRGSAVGYDVRGQTVANQNYLANLFGINSSGSLVVQNALSRDSVQQVRIVVAVADSGTQLSATATLVITITAPLVRLPVFLPVGISSLTAVVSSTGSRIGDTVARVAAVNQDTVGASVSYYVIHDSDWSRSFDITDANRNTGIVTITGGMYASAPSGIPVNLTVVAAYSLQPGINSSAILSVQVVGGGSVNNGGGNNLSWIYVPQTINMAENSSIGSFVASVAATCATGNCSIVYVISAGNELKDFRIDSATGVVYTADLLDREITPQYNLLITAASPLGNITRVIYITVTDNNDKPPVFDLSLYGSSIPGDLPVGSSVLTVRATDADTGVNAALTYSIDYSDPRNGSRLFVIDPISGEISSGSSLLGVNGDLFLSVIARDRGQPPLSGSTVVRITVNSNVPRFISPPENVTVLANTSTAYGNFVVQVKALLGSGSVVYELVASSADFTRFFINSNTGVISAATQLDPTRPSPYSLVVRAYNSLKFSYESFRTVSIMVRNASVPLPQFDPVQFQSPFSLSVVEGRTGIILATFKATQVSQYVCYYIVGGTTAYMNSFYLEKTSGVLTVTSSLDRSRVSVLTLVVKTTDDCWSGYWEMESNRNMAMSVSDPSLLLVQVKVLSSSQFIIPTIYSAVNREAQFGQTVLQLADYVRQYSSNAVQYSLLQPFWISQSPMSTNISSLGIDPFVVSPMDGSIRTNIYFQSTWSGFFQTVVAVNDGNSNSIRSTANLTIYVLEDDQRVVVICRSTPDVIGSRRVNLTNILSVMSSLSVGIDAIESHGGSSLGSHEPTDLTDVYVHAINASTGQVLKASDLQSILRASNDTLKDSLIQDILTRDEAVAQALRNQSSTSPALSSLERSLIIALAVTGAVLLVAIAVISAIFCIYRRRYKRQVKAADALAATKNNASRLQQQHQQRDATPASDDIFAGTNPIWLDRIRHDPYQQFGDTDTDSSKNSSEDPPISSTSASTVALDSQSPNVARNSALSSSSAELPRSGAAQENGPQPNGSASAVQLDPETGLWVYRDADGNKRPVVSNGHAPVQSHSVPSSVFALHSTNV